MPFKNTEKCDETYFFTLLKLRYLKLKTYNVCMFLKTCNFGIKGNNSLKESYIPGL
jgi:hypothetical protein